jgi:hypothetical protein
MNNTIVFCSFGSIARFICVLGAIAIVRSETIVQWYHAGFVCIGAADLATTLADRRSRFRRVIRRLGAIAWKSVLGGLQHFFLQNLILGIHLPLQRQRHVAATHLGMHMRPVWQWPWPRWVIARWCEQLAFSAASSNSRGPGRARGGTVDKPV